MCTNNPNDSNKLNSLTDNLYKLLLTLNKKIFNIQDLMKKFKAPGSHVKVLFYLVHHGSSPISEVANDLMISKPNMTPIIDKLVADGFITRYYDPNDRRVIRVEATSAACDFLRAQEIKIKENLTEKISTLSIEDLDKLNSSIQQLSDILLKIQ